VQTLIWARVRGLLCGTVSAIIPIVVGRPTLLSSTWLLSADLHRKRGDLQFSLSDLGQADWWKGCGDVLSGSRDGCLDARERHDIGWWVVVPGGYSRNGFQTCPILSFLQVTSYQYSSRRQKKVRTFCHHLVSLKVNLGNRLTRTSGKWGGVDITR
jgi:hypothetical protein